MVQVNQSNRGSWHPVVFASPFVAPPVVVMGPASYNDNQPTTVRVRSVTTTGFEFKIDEWNYLDGVHGQESIGYLALDPGVHQLGGLTWEATRLSGVGSVFQTVPFAGSFASKPVVLAQVVTTLNTVGGQNRALITRVQNVTSTSFAVRIQAEESYQTALSGETVCVLAVSPGLASIPGFRVLASVVFYK